MLLLVHKFPSKLVSNSKLIMMISLQKKQKKELKLTYQNLQKDTKNAVTTLLHHKSDQNDEPGEFGEEMINIIQK